MDLNRKIRHKEAKIAVIGLGYVGLPLAVEKAKAGFRVTGLDRKEERVAKVNNGENYIPDVLDVELSDAVNSGKLCATGDYEIVAHSDVVTICVPTPLDEAKNPDTRYIENVVENALPYAHKDQLFILESTTYPGTTEEVIQPRLEDAGFTLGEDIYLAFSPERVDPGNNHHKTGNTPKVVGGVTKECTEVAKSLYEEVIDESIHPVSSPAVAEMEKLLENVFRIVNISLVNELAMLTDKMDINIWEVIEAAKTKPFGFMPFYPGPGLGGHCIPLDPFYLSWKAKQHDFFTRFIDLAGQINAQMPEYVVQKSMELLNEKGKSLRDSKIKLIGVAYKEDVDDIRESPALEIMKKFKQRGAEVFYHDPHIDRVSLNGSTYNSRPLDADNLKDADLVLITTAHSNIQYDKVVENADLIYDTRNGLNGLDADHVYKLGS